LHVGRSLDERRERKRVKALIRTLWTWFIVLLLSASAFGDGQIEFDSCVNWRYTYRKDLSGWRNTSLFVEQSLRQWFPGMRVGQVFENTSPKLLTNFLEKLPVSSRARVNIVYLASHQSPAGEWHFPNGSMVDWGTLIDRSHAAAHPMRVVIMDSCYASSVLRFDQWRRFATLSVFSAAAAEDTAELDFKSRQPIDMEHRYPEVATWLKNNAPKHWDGRISLLGFVWVKAFLETPKPPLSRGDWVDFFKRCEHAADDFRSKTDGKFASTVSFQPSE
jgi:hypothetical protein